MPSLTPTMGLKKPFAYERYDVGVANENSDTIDSAINGLGSSIKDLDSSIKAWVQPAVNDRNNPNTWAITGEIDFGDGTYGMRRQGTITAAAGARNVTTLGTPSVMVNIISSGGWISFDGTARYALNGSYVRANTDTLPAYFSALAQSSARNITMATLNTYAARTDAPYDVWIRYAK